MTRISGFARRAAPCCNAVFEVPVYVSMNFSALAYWTDGWREFSPMPNDQGLRRCVCGAYLTLAQLREVGGCSFDRAAGLHEVDAAELPHVLAQTENPEVALAARLAWWQALNHAYRERYRLHRDAEEAHTQALWQAQNPSSQSWWAKLRKRTPIRYVPAPGRPFTYPPFVPNAEQRDNMHALLALLDAACARAPQWALMAEVQRQLGMFGQAQRTMAQLARPLWTYGEVLIQQLIAEQEPAPMRYRL